MEQAELPGLSKHLRVVESMTDPGVYYEVDTQKGTCSCPAWRRGITRPCKHMKSVMPDLVTAEGFAGWEVYDHSKDRIDVESSLRQGLLSSVETRLNGEASKYTELFGTPQEIELQIEKLLKEDFEQAMSEGIDPPRGVKLKEKSRKWIAVSGLQKAIRRGNPILAQRMIEALYRENVWYTMNRMVVILTEDVGVGDLWLTAMYLWWMNQEKEYREKHGELEVMIWFAKQAASTIKSRHNCDVLNIGEGHPSYEWVHELPEWSDGELFAVAEHDDPVVACAAARVMMKRGVEEGKKNWKYLYALMEGADPVARYVAWQAMRKIRDSHPLSTPFVWRAFQHSKSVWLESSIEVSLGMVGHFAAECVDQHVSDGKRAIAYWSKVIGLHDLYNEWGVDVEKRNALTGIALFRLEGDSLDCELCYDDTHERRQEYKWSAMRNVWPVTEEQSRMLLDVMRVNAEALLAARKKMLGVYT